MTWSDCCENSARSIPSPTFPESSPVSTCRESCRGGRHRRDGISGDAFAQQSRLQAFGAVSRGAVNVAFCYLNVLLCGLLVIWYNNFYAVSLIDNR